MDKKAFNKIVGEAEEAIAERRIIDALELIEAITQDTTDSVVSTETGLLRERYSQLLRTFTAISHDYRATESNALIRQTIDALEKAVDAWKRDHPKTSAYATFASKLLFVSEDDIIDQLQRISRQRVGQDNYHTALDAAFVMLWCLTYDAHHSQLIASRLALVDSFARRTLTSALLLSSLDHFDCGKLHLLLSLTTAPETDSDGERDDLTARLAVALAIIALRYGPLLDYYDDERRQMRAFFERPDVRGLLPTLLCALTAQANTDLAYDNIETIETIIKDMFVKQQPRLGDEQNGQKQQDTPATDAPKEMHMEMFSVNQVDNEELFNKLNTHVRKIDELRRMNIDVNLQSFTNMKHFSFFNVPAHWFYPFSVEVPPFQQALIRKNGKPDKLTLSIMTQNMFCASDCYSYLSMMGFIRNKGKDYDEFNELINDQLEDLQDELDEFMDDVPRESVGLHPLYDYCQSLHRFFNAQNVDIGYTFRPFDKHLLPLPFHPLFDGLFDSYSALQPAIELLTTIGGFDEAIALLTFAAEHFGIDAQLLNLRGFAYMGLQQWQRALSDFQQLLLFEDNPEAQLAMARCFEALGYWDKALPLLVSEEKRQTEADESRALNIIEETGRCLIELRQWDEAVQRFFRLELMEKHLNVARRAIAWCSIKQGKYERAAVYYQKLIDQHKANWEDRLNCGHALWLQGREAEALQAYKQSQADFNRSKKAQRHHFRHWSEAFGEDCIDILAPTFDRTECALMLDAVLLH